MSSLVAKDLRQRELVHRRWSLVDGVDVPLGRSVKKGQLQTEWDKNIADWHAVVRSEPDRLFIQQRADIDPCHAIFYNGAPCDEFTIVPGEGFVIGTTIFLLEPALVDQSKATGGNSASRTVYFDVKDLRTQLSSDNEQLSAINALSQRLKDGQLNVEEFEDHVLQTLRQAVRRADFAAILHLRDDKLEVSSSNGDLAVCQQLAKDAIHKQLLIEHRWGSHEASRYPTVAGAAWAVCAPVLSSVAIEGDYAIYISGGTAASGSKNSRTLPEDQLSFVAIVADFLQSAYTLSDLSARHKSIEIFFPKGIRDLLLSHGPSGVFQTEEVQAAILFCDLRGSSQLAEKWSHDLMAAWSRIKEALSIMTEAITNQDGSIGDFQGDAAMGFWGWPRKSVTKDRLLKDVHEACQAADKLRERFQQKSRDEGPLADFACGIGLAAGSVVAGVLGTLDQRKIGVFGPTVNLAARLESMTKQWGASVLIDEQAQKALVQSGSQLAPRMRMLATVQPVGMQTPVRIFELMPPPSDAALSSKQLKLFEFGRNAFEQGNWTDARVSLAQLASAGDGPSKFLVEYIDRLQTPPKDWKGCVVMTAK